MFHLYYKKYYIIIFRNPNNAENIKNTIKIKIAYNSITQRQPLLTNLWTTFQILYACVYIYTHTHTHTHTPSKTGVGGLPWWRSGWESACQCRGHGFEPWSGKIPHAAEQLGPWATTTEPERLEPVLCNKRGRNSERPVHCDEEWPPLATTRESPCTEMKTQHSHKLIN